MSKKSTNIIVVTKNQSLKKQLSKLFNDSSVFNTEWLEGLNRLLKYFKTSTYDLLILSGDVCNNKTLDYKDLLKIISKESPQTQILLIVKENNLSIAMEAMEVGGYQYVRIPAPDYELKLIIDLALSKKPEFGANKLLEDDESIYRFEGFIGRSPAIQAVYRQIQQVAATNIPVLLIGETGTGKDLAAQAIHHLSFKKDGNYMPVNLGALPSELIASELFGHEKGSFTGATQQHKGVFEMATDGTVFLDEIDSIDHKVQTSLLRLVEQKKFTRLGGRRSLHTNGRLITASNENLDDLVKHGKFREDLFFRLDVFRIVLPPLRERISDVSLITEELIGRFNHELNKSIIRIDQDCLSALEEYEWPGNVRELKNVIQRAVLVCQGDELHIEHLPKRFQIRTDKSSKIIIEIGKTLNEVEKQLIHKTLAHTKNNRKKAAELLGITLSLIHI